jgi:hypothetical protein
VSPTWIRRTTSMVGWVGPRCQSLPSSLDPRELGMSRVVQINMGRADARQGTPVISYTL